MTSIELDEMAVFEVLFCGIPAEEPNCWYSRHGLASSIGWSQQRFEDAVSRLQSRGVLTVEYSARDDAYARCPMVEPWAAHLTEGNSA